MLYLYFVKMRRIYNAQQPTFVRYLVAAEGSVEAQVIAKDCELDPRDWTHEETKYVGLASASQPLGWYMELS